MRMGEAQTTQSFDNYRACVAALIEKAEEIRFIIPSVLLPPSGSGM